MNIRLALIAACYILGFFLIYLAAEQHYTTNVGIVWYFSLPLALIAFLTPYYHTEVLLGDSDAYSEVMSDAYLDVVNELMTFDGRLDGMGVQYDAKKFIETIPLPYSNYP